MKAKHVAWIAVTIITAAAVGSTAALGVAVHQEYSELDHGQAPQSPEVSQLVQPQQPQAVDTADMPARLDEMAQSPALPTLGAQVINTSTGEVLWEHDSQEALIPASSTKVLTAAAAALLIEIGRASCRERVEISVVGISLKKINKGGRKRAERTTDRHGITKNGVCSRT